MKEGERMNVFFTKNKSVDHLLLCIILLSQKHTREGRTHGMSIDRLRVLRKREEVQGSSISAWDCINHVLLMNNMEKSLTFSFCDFVPQ